MIIVTGTMRSGTSMWMQILEAAGLPIIGKDFPGKWKQRIGEANAGGFFESTLRDGIYYRTNPHPQTGSYLRPDQTRRHAVKVFAQGLVRSDVAFLDRVVLSVRPWREYAASITRLMEMERRSKSQELGRELPPQPHVPHALRWWDDNFSAFRDALIRGYPTHSMTYATVLHDREAVARTLRWLGAPDVEGGLSRVKADRQTQRDPEQADADPAAELGEGTIEVFDELYERVDSSRGFDDDFVARMNRVDEDLQPRLREAMADVKRQLKTRARPTGAAT